MAVEEQQSVSEPERVPDGPVPDNVRAYITPVAARLRDQVQSERAAREVATAMVYRANHLATERRLRGYEVERQLERMEARFDALVQRTQAALKPGHVDWNDAALAAACLYAHEFGRERWLEAREDALVSRAEELHFLTPMHSPWEPALSALQRPTPQKAQSELFRALCSELRDRVPSGLEPRLRAAADSAAKQTRDDWHGRRLDPQRAASLPRVACLEAWRYLVGGIAKSLPLAELGRLTRRTFVDKDRRPLDEEIAAARTWFSLHAPLCDLRDDALLATVARAAPRFNRGKEELEYEDALDAGRPPDVSQDFDPVLDAPGLAGDIADRHEQLKLCVAAAMQALVDEKGKAARDAAILKLVTGRGSYDHVDVLKVKRADDGKTFVPRPKAADDENEAWISMKRAYDRLRGRLSHDGYLMLDKPEGDGERREAILDASRLLVPNGTPRPVDCPLTGAPALERELDRASLRDVVAELCAVAWPAADDEPASWEPIAAAFVELTLVRRWARGGLDGPHVRFLFEPVIHGATDLPDGLAKHLRMRADKAPKMVPPGCQRSGRIVVVAPADPPALPIERKHDQVRHRNVIPRLPEPLVKTHTGRWWHFPAGGVEC